MTLSNSLLKSKKTYPDHLQSVYMTQRLLNLLCVGGEVLRSRRKVCRSTKFDNLPIMKKWLLGVSFVVLLILSAIYLFIPATINISKNATASANQQGVFRFLSNEKNWNNWWPGEVRYDQDTIKELVYKNLQFEVTKLLHNAFEITISTRDWKIGSLLQIFSYATDSIGLQWSTQLGTGINPIGKVQLHLAANGLEGDLKDILERLKKHILLLKNVYGIDIKNEKVQVQLLVSTKEAFPHYPNNREIYGLVDKLKEHRRLYNAFGDTIPMLSIQRLDSVQYTAQVALPVNKNLPEENGIAGKWMMKGGNILTAEVVGGANRVDSSMKQMEKYISDYQRSIIAIPFQLLLTDRRNQPDSTKWLTRIYYPVI